MDREVEFRGMRWPTGTWLYGYLVRIEDKSYIIKTFSDNNIFHNKVMPETVGQYIGLKDDEGQKIYEGDVIGAGIYRKEICFSEFHAGFVGKPVRKYDLLDPEDLKYSGQLLSQEWIHQCEVRVLGNVTENPDLLKCEDNDGKDNR